MQQECIRGQPLLSLTFQCNLFHTQELTGQQVQQTDLRNGCKILLHVHKHKDEEKCHYIYPIHKYLLSLRSMPTSQCLLILARYLACLPSQSLDWHKHLVGPV